MGYYMAAKYRHTKAYWKNKHYHNYSTDVERMKHKPDDCDENDWKKLLRYWVSPDVQKIAIRNNVNHCRQVIRHTRESRRFANIEYDMEVDMGITPTRGDLFVKTHTRVDNSPSEPSSEIIINEMKRLQLGEALQAGESTMSNSISDLVYYKLFPKECHGHVKGCGPGVKRKDIGICSSTGQVQGGTGTEIESLNLHIEKLKLRDMERDAEMDAMKHSLLEKDAKLDKMEKQMQMFMCLLGDAPSCYVSDYSKLPGKRCKILDFLDSGVIVAEGSCESSNSETLVHGVCLGYGASNVWIGEVRQHNYKLWSPTFDIVEIGEAQNNYVAWPTKYIIMD